MSSTPLFVVSAKGLAAASKATPVGPFIEIKSFAVGSAVGYFTTPEDLRNDEDLSGDRLYEGAISSYAYVGDNIINIVCKLPPDAGPFDFGEVALYLADGTMFAKAVFDKLQTKYSSLGTNLALTYTFNCLLQLEQSVAVFKILGADSGGRQEVLTVSRWSEVVPPEMSANPDVSMLVVQEVDNKGDSTLLCQASSTKWTLSGTYFPLGNFVLENASNTWLELDDTQWPYIDSVKSPYPVENCSMVVEFPDGYYRSVASIQHIGTPVSKVRLLLNPDPLGSLPSPGSSVTIYANQAGVGNAYSLWVNLRKLISNSITPLTVQSNKPRLDATISGAGEASASVIVTANGNAPFTFYWSNVQGNATFDDPTKASVVVKAQLVNGATQNGVVQCKVTDSFGLSTTINVPWTYVSELAWVVPTQAMFPGCTSFSYDAATKRSRVTYGRAGTFSFTPPNAAAAAIELIGGGGGGGGGAKTPTGNSNYAWGGAGGGGGAGGFTTQSGIPLIGGKSYPIVCGGGGTGGKSVDLGLAESGANGQMTSAFDVAAPGGLGGKGAYSMCCGSDPGDMYGRGGAGVEPSGGNGGAGARGGAGPGGGIHIANTAATGNNAGLAGSDGAGGYCGGGAGGGGANGQLGGDGGDAGTGQSGGIGRRGGGGGGSSGGWNGGATGGAGGDGEIVITF